MATYRVAENYNAAKKATPLIIIEKDSPIYIDASKPSLLLESKPPTAAVETARTGAPATGDEHAPKKDSKRKSTGPAAGLVEKKQRAARGSKPPKPLKDGCGCACGVCPETTTSEIGYDKSSRGQVCGKCNARQKQAFSYCWGENPENPANLRATKMPCWLKQCENVRVMGQGGGRQGKNSPLLAANAAEDVTPATGAAQAEHTEVFAPAPSDSEGVATTASPTPSPPRAAMAALPPPGAGAVQPQSDIQQRIQKMAERQKRQRAHRQRCDEARDLAKQQQFEAHLAALDAEQERKRQADEAKCKAEAEAEVAAAAVAARRRAVDELEHANPEDESQ
jgi:hypothetical protein